MNKIKLLKSLANQRLLIDKRGEKLFSIWWFIIIIIVGLGIITGVNLFYSFNLDVRSLESDILANKVIKCVADSGGINVDILNEDFDLYSKCEISQSVLENNKYFVKISVMDFFSGNVLIEHKYGNNVFERDCEIKSKLIAQNYPECSEKTVYVIDSDGNKYLINVLTASNYKGGKI
ncbi:hypothetical protein J4477_04200 [Candidatus Pacearchaeota archaeon]|nr:hypothetical protein [Candidatus Pacearchaeota archaeon]